MKIWTSEHIFEHSWDTVVSAVWKKYPNPENTSVTAVDVLNRDLGSDGVLRSHRILQTNWKIPSWATALGIANPSYSHEYSEVCPQRRTMTLKTTNLTFTNIVTIDENITYKPHPECSSKTVLEQSATIKVKGLPLVNYLEGFVLNLIDSNAQKGRQAMEWVIGNVRRGEDLLKQEYAEISSKISHECEEIAQEARGMLRGLDELSVNLERDAL